MSYIKKRTKGAQYCVSGKEYTDYETIFFLLCQTATVCLSMQAQGQIPHLKIGCVGLCCMLSYIECCDPTE